MAKDDNFYSKTVFTLLNSEEKRLLFDISKICTFNKGEVFHYENDELEDIYFLLSGHVKTYKINRFENEVFLYSFNKPSLITTFSFEDKINYCFSNIECLKDSKVLSINIKNLKDLALKYPNILLFFHKEIFSKIRIYQYIINREIIFDGTAKVIYMLTNSLEEFNALKKQEVAYMLNIQPETLSRILTKLKRDGLIETSEDGNVIVLNIKKLNSIFK